MTVCRSGRTAAVSWHWWTFPWGALADRRWPHSQNYLAGIVRTKTVGKAGTRRHRKYSLPNIVHISCVNNLSSFGLQARLRTPKFCLSGQGSRSSRSFLQARIQGGGWRSTLPIEMAPLGIMPPSEIGCRPSSFEWCRPRWRAQKRSTEFFMESGRKKRSTKIVLDTGGRLSTRPSGLCRPLSPRNNAALGQAAPCL